MKVNDRYNKHNIGIKWRTDDEDFDWFIIIDSKHNDW